MNPRARTGLRLASGGLILALLLWRLGAEPFLEGIRRIDAASVGLALAGTLVATVGAAWRWTVVACALGVTLPLREAVGAYYRSQFLNVVVPGGVVGDVERALRHGRQAGQVARAVRSVVWERLGGQLVQVVVAAAVLLAVPSPLRSAVPAWVLGVAGVTLVAGSALLGAAALGARPVDRLVTHTGAARPSPLGRWVTTAGQDVRDGLLSTHALPRVVAASLVVVAAHTGVFLVAATAVGVGADLGSLVPLALVVLVVSSLPLNVAGWGPREGAAAWGFAVAGLGAQTGVAVSTAYGVLVILSLLPGGGLVLLQAVQRRYRDAGATDAERQEAEADA